MSTLPRHLLHLIAALPVLGGGAACGAGEAASWDEPAESALAAAPAAARMPATFSLEEYRATVTDSLVRAGLTAADSGAELPRVFVNTAMPPVTGRSRRVRAGDDLQRSLDAARPGDELVLDPGATFTGSFVLRRKPGASGGAWITIRTAGTLPPAGTRVSPANAAQMPKLVAAHPTESALLTEAGAHHYRLVGLEIAGARGRATGYTLVALGDGGEAQKTLDQVPHHLVLDRVYIHGSPTLGLQRCVGLNSGTTAIVDSYLTDCHGKGFDSQAIGGWNGPGPYKIVNNYLAGAGENVMFGGADPHIRGLTPSDIEIRRNHLHKPLDWRGRWTVKNLFELKHAQRVLVEGNVMENNWVDAQAGFAVLFTPLSDNNSAPWTTVRDVTFRHNVVRNSPAGVNVSGGNAYGPNPVWPEPAARIDIVNNLLVDIGAEGQNGRLFQLLNDIRGLRIAHNTGLATHSAILFESDRGPLKGLVVKDNVLAHGEYGFFSSNGQGSAALAHFAPGAVVSGNVLIGAPADRYPAGNFFPPAARELFINRRDGDYRLRSFAATGIGARADDGKPRGVDMAALREATDGVVQKP